MSNDEKYDEQKHRFPNIKSPSHKVYRQKIYKKERPISKAYPVIDNDLARDNIENDLTSADLRDL